VVLITVVFGTSWVVPGFAEASPESPTGMTGKVDAAQRSRAEKVLTDNSTWLLSTHGVVGVGMGLTESGDRAAIHVYVDWKVEGGRGSQGIPCEIDGVPVRIIRTGAIKAR